MLEPGKERKKKGRKENNPVHRGCFGLLKNLKKIQKKFRQPVLFHLHPSRYKISKLIIKIQMDYFLVYTIHYLINLN